MGVATQRREEAPVTRAEQLHDQAEFLRSLAESSRISSKREQLLRAAEHCEVLVASLEPTRTRKSDPATADLGEPYLTVPARRH
jgi:hypothetical protein